LRRWKMSVTTADTAAAAISTLRDAAGHGRPYDVLILDADPGDVHTPGLARTVHADDTTPAVHTVVLNETPPTGRADDTGAPTYLPKPVHRSALYDLLAQSMAAVLPAPVPHHVPPPAPPWRPPPPRTWPPPPRPPSPTPSPRPPRPAAARSCWSRTTTSTRWS